ncbi:cyclase family protein [Natrarchaeobius sp. A-rgal3]|uniref:cyclase family protein n=1 Tax=Natrarchaeobius versutus TaxID=1679078 RepID=UPI0035101C0F
MSEYRLVDVSMPMDGFDFAGDQPFEVTGPFDRVSGSNPEYVYDLGLSTQTGTHVQGAHYFAEDGKRIGEYSLERFEGRAACIDLEKRGVDATVDDLEAALGSGPLPDGMLILRTGHMEEVLETGVLDADSRPGLSLEAARWLVEEKDLELLAIDSVGVESRDTRNYEVNVYLGEQDVLILEGLVNLDSIGETEVWLEAFPLKVRDVEGTPCRAVVKEPVDEVAGFSRRTR